MSYRHAKSISLLAFSLCVGLTFALVLSSHAQAPPAELKNSSNTNEQAKRFASLEKSLTGAALVGHFTETGKAAIDPKAERYELKTVKHVEDDRWLFEARITYGEHDVTVPLTLPVKWAGDTPVITVDNMGIPGLGLYTARVMIYADHYAGFWSGGDHGGHLFGVIERSDENEN